MGSVLLNSRSTFMKAPAHTCAPLAAALVAALATASILVAPAVAADETGNFVLRLGQDTTSVEQYTRSASKLEVNQVGRSPRVLQRRFTYDLQNGAVTKLSMVVGPPGWTTPTQTIKGGFDVDSLRLHVQNGENRHDNTGLL